ncbi:Asp-tRNA(Asn)/Glu-tRNA(Gln) amidotransferase subunit GatA [Candidatus Parcubacteria bacterium]|nr:Asp-tRNA(Asn)/Glu-tRNA(Gln) amidotransferase subunit GatA [Patescibacteria group bacterium]MCG2694265.1 Asp-tRNA(Asn)/Glu-tRNA(Gln) amidotransferase subunit GatA [Candidatus Parcubacteria bacterium]
MKLNELTIKQAHEGLKSKDFSALSLVNDCITAIEEKNADLNAYLSVFKESAIRDAKRVDEKLAQKEEIGELEGIPLAIKDNILIQDTKCTAGSKILENYVSAYDATIIKKLREAGAIFLGKTNMDEFACGSSTESSAFGPTKNPLNQKKVPGGSSGGSAAALSADMCLGAFGSDTGGSVRQPASLCGNVGFKPSYGRVSRYGLMALASSFDQISPFAKTVEDAELLYKTIAGKDSHDSTTVDKQLGLDEKINFKKLRVGLPKEYYKGLGGNIKDKIEEKVNILKGLGAEIKEVSLPHTDYALAVYYIIMPSELSSNLARFDGVRYGYSAYKNGSVKNLLEAYMESRAIGFGKEIKRRTMIGTYALSSGYYDAYYKKATAVRAVIKQDFDKAFNEVDCLITPTSPSVAWNLGEKMDDPLKMYLSDIYTVSANVAGIPAISIPCGDIDGLPIGLQVMGRQFDENTVLRTAKELYI